MFKHIFKDLFECSDFYMVDNKNNYIDFFDCVLKRNIGNHNAGKEINLIRYDFISGLLEFHIADKNYPEETFCFDAFTVTLNVEEN